MTANVVAGSSVTAWSKACSESTLCSCEPAAMVARCKWGRDGYRGDVVVVAVVVVVVFADGDDGNGLLRYALRFWAQKENVDGDVGKYMYLSRIRDQVGMGGDVELFVLSILT